MPNQGWDFPQQSVQIRPLELKFNVSTSFNCKRLGSFDISEKLTWAVFRTYMTSCLVQREPYRLLNSNYTSLYDVRTSCNKTTKRSGFTDQSSFKETFQLPLLHNQVLEAILAPHLQWIQGVACGWGWGRWIMEDVYLKKGGLETNDLKLSPRKKMVVLGESSQTALYKKNDHLFVKQALNLWKPYFLGS